MEEGDSWTVFKFTLFYILACDIFIFIVINLYFFVQGMSGQSKDFLINIPVLSMVFIIIGLLLVPLMIGYIYFIRIIKKQKTDDSIT